MLTTLAIVLSGGFFWTTAEQPNAPVATDAPLVEQYLLSGELAEGEDAAAAALKSKQNDDAARFGLGTVQFVRAVERLLQSLNRFGFQSPPALGMVLPMGRLPIGENPNPQKLSYAQLRTILQTWFDDLSKAEATLAGIKDATVKLPLHFAMIRLDFDGDGKATEAETLWQVYAKLNRQAEVTAVDAQQLVITLDAGDAQWLRGYCHLLMAISEIVLAYDEKELFERTGHLIFQNIETPHAYLNGETKVYEMGGLDIMDLIAYVHLINLPLKEPARMGAALKHVESMLACSREMWKLISAETDDDHEWIPNPKQTGVVPGVKITEEMIDGWRGFLDEAEALCSGKRLIPFWRTSDDTGVNLKRVFTEPGNLDLVLWIQGTAATPYLEKGSLTRKETWERLERIFQGEFVGFAIWFN